MSNSILKDIFMARKGNPYTAQGYVEESTYNELSNYAFETIKESKDLERQVYDLQEEVDDLREKLKKARKAKKRYKRKWMELKNERMEKI